MNTTFRSISVLLLTAIITAGSLLLIGPQIVIIVPVAVIAGIFFTIKRSFWALACFGYPFTFGLVSAYIGWKEVSGYTQTGAFAISIAIGLVGVALIASGLWLALSAQATQKKQTCSILNKQVRL